MAASAGRRATGRATTRSSRRCERLEEDETLLVQSGKPVGVFRTHADAPRVLIANSNLVPKWATWEHFNELDRKGLMMYGQMTAGSWIYIGTQGIVQGTYETFAEMGRQHYGGDLARPLDPDRGPRRHGRRAAARGGDGRRPLLAIECQESRIEKRLETRYLDRARDHRSTRRSTCSRASAGADLGRPARQCRRDPARDGAGAASGPTRHRPDLGARPGQRLSADRLDASSNGSSMRERDPKAVETAARASMAVHVEAMLAFQRDGRADLRLRQQHPPGREGRGRRPTPSISPASCRPISGRSSAAASARSAGRRCRAIPRTSTGPTPR